MNEHCVFVQNIKDLGPVPESGIISRTLQTDPRSKVIHFTFAPGQELSAHTAPFPALLYFVRGEATVVLGGERRDAGEGTFVYMPPLLEHGIHAKTEVVMLLVMIKAGATQ